MVTIMESCPLMFDRWRPAAELDAAAPVSLARTASVIVRPVEVNDLGGDLGGVLWGAPVSVIRRIPTQGTAAGINPATVAGVDPATVAGIDPATVAGVDPATVAGINPATISEVDPATVFASRIVRAPTSVSAPAVSVYKNLNFLPALNLCMIQAGYKVYVLM
jgi:hypothetical protein